MSLVQKSFSDIITFSRTSNATRIGPTGLVEYAPHNLCLQSQTFDNASWTKTTGVTVTANASAAPDGTVTADKINYDGTGSSGSFRIYNSVGTSVNGSYYTSSIWLRADSATTVRLYGNGVAGNYVTCNLTSTWQRFSTTGLGDGVQGLQLLLYSPASVNTSFEIYAWGAQLSVGPYALDYTPTTSAAVYGPRFDYDPVTLAARGLLIEESRTNLLTYSEQFDNASWTVNNATVTANSTTAPDGTNTADLLTEDSSSGVHRLYKNITLTSVSHSASIYAKPNGRSWIYIRMDTASGLQAWFNISTGQVGTVQSGLTASIQSVGNGWYRCVISGVAVVSNNFLVGLSDANNGGNYAGDGTSGAYLWGAQLEAGSFATSYLPTLASTVTRSADVASVDTLSPWFNATTGTIYTEVNRYAENVDVRGTVFSDGTLDNYLGSSAYTFSGQGGVVVASSVGQVGLGSGSTSIGIKKFAFAYGANDFALSENGGSVTTDTSGTVPTLTMMGIGSLIAGYVGTGHVRRIAYYPRRLTDAELQALTA